MYDGTLKFDTSMDTEGFQKGAGSLTSIVKGLGIFSILQKGIDAVVGSLDSAVSRYDTLNQYPKMLQLMGYSAEDTSESAQKLSDGIAGLPTTLDDVVATSQRLTILTNNLEESTDLTLALNNAFLASGASSDSAARGLEQYVQMLSSGKVDMQSWKTLQETMGLALNKVAEAFGFAGESAQKQLYAALQDGEITFSQFSAMIIKLNSGVGGFAELAKASTSGIGTAWTNMKTAIVRGTTGIITAIDKGLSKTKFKSIETAIEQMKGGIVNALSAIASAFGWAAENSSTLIPLLVSIGAVITAWKIGSVLTILVTGFQTAALQVALYKLSVDGAITADALQTAGLAAKEIIVGVLTGKIGLATAAQYVWNAAMTANPIGLVIAGVTALIAGIAALVIAINKGSKSYQAQKNEVEELISAQEELASSLEDSRESFEKSCVEMEVAEQNASGLVDELYDISGGTDSAATKAARMAETVNKLNLSVEGLNIAYDEETGTLRNINSNQEVSLDQLKQLVDAKMEVAKTDAWTQRQVELLAEQARIQTELTLIERKRQEILADTSMSASEQNKLIADLDASAEGYAAQMEDVDARLEIVNENLAASSADTAGQIISDYERMESAVTKNGENIEQVAEQWGVSTDDIIAAMKEQNISLDDWVSAQEEAMEEQEKAWEEFEATVKDKVDGVVNSFEEIPSEYEQSAAEMLEILKNNKEQYARWEANMEEITRLLGPTAAEEFGKLGPEANSAMEEILGSADLLAEYQEVFGVRIDEATGAAIENWNDPNFIGAPTAAVEDSAAQLASSTALGDAAAGQVDTAIASMEEAVEDADLSSFGQEMAESVQNGFAELDLSAVASTVTKQMQATSRSVITSVRAMMSGIGTAISAGSSNVKNQAASLSDGITRELEPLETDGKNQTIRMMTQMALAIITRSSSVQAPVRKTASGISEILEEMAADGQGHTERMMIQAAAAIAGKKSAVTVQANALSSGVVSNLEGMVSGGQSASRRMMEGILAAMVAGSYSVYSKAAEIANTVAATMRNSLQVRSPSRVMFGIFKNVMLGITGAMDTMKESVFSRAAGIAAGISQRLTITPELAGLTNTTLLSVSDAVQRGVSVPMAATISRSSASTASGSEADSLLQEALALLGKYLPTLANMKVVLDTGATVGELASPMNEELGRIARREERG